MSSDESDRPPEPEPVGPDAVPPATRSGRRGGLVGALLIYTGLRVGLIAAITALLVLFMPFIVALLFALILQLPFSWLLFAGPRRRVNEAVAASTAHRRAERQRLQAALSGDDGPAQSDPRQG